MKIWKTRTSKSNGINEITLNGNLMQQGNFIYVFIARRVSGTHAHHQEHWMLGCSIRFSEPSFWMGGGLKSSCVGRVYSADGAVCVCSLTYPSCKAHTLYRHLWPVRLSHIFPHYHINGTILGKKYY